MEFTDSAEQMSIDSGSDVISNCSSSLMAVNRPIKEEMDVIPQSWVKDVPRGSADGRNQGLPLDTDSSDSEKSVGPAADESDDSRSTTSGNWKRSKCANRYMEATHPLKTQPNSTNVAFAQASRILQNQPAQTDSKKLINKFNVWSNVLAEQGLVQDLNLVGVNGGCLPNERDCESYDYTIKYRLNEGLDQEPQEIHRRLGLKRNSKDRSSSHLPLLEKNRRSFTFSENDTKEKVIAGIVAILREPKKDLLSRVVSILGKKKSIELLKRTEDIEESGGMMTLDSSRRRTPGGVFLQLLKRDRYILKSQMDRIFEAEHTESLKTKNQIKKAKRKRGKKKKEMAVTEPDPLPILPSLPELLLAKHNIMKELKAEDCSENLDSTDSEKESGELDSDDSIED